MSNIAAITLIADERKRQAEKEGWSVEHDDAHTDGSLALAAACYAVQERLYTRSDCSICGSANHSVVAFSDAWPWDIRFDKRNKHDTKRRLVIAGALIVAEIERLERMASDE